MKLINKNRLVTIIITGIILVNTCGCDNKLETTTNNNNLPMTTSNAIKNTSNNNTSGSNERQTSNEEAVSPKTDSKQEKTVVQSNAVTISKDEEIKNYFNNLKDDVQKYVNEDNLEKVKDKLDQAFITMVDFIFYNREIKGTTFSDLSDTTKKEILDTAKNIDNIIIKKYPNYKVTIKGKAETVRSFLGEKLDNSKDLIKNKIGEEKYDEIKNEYEDVKDKASEVKDKTLSKIKNWYENKRDNQ